MRFKLIYHPWGIIRIARGFFLKIPETTKFQNLRVLDFFKNSGFLKLVSRYINVHSETLFGQPRKIAVANQPENSKN